MRWCLLLAMIATSAFGQSTGRQKVDEALAQVYYLRGQQAESLSDSAYRRWVRNVDVNAFDNATDRIIFALDQFQNAVRLDPSHWRAHQHLGLLEAKAGGSFAHDVLALLHLTCYMALAPDDPGTVEAKQIADARLNEVRRVCEQSKLSGEDHLPVEDAVSLAVQAAVNDFYRSTRRVEETFDTAERLAVYARSFPDSYAQEIKFNAELADRIRSRNEGATMGGEMMGSGGEMMVSDSGGAGAEGGGEGGGSTSVAATDAAEGPVVREISLITRFVPTYLGIMGSMHLFMNELDRRQKAYDPRLPESLIGESVVQLRRLFTRGAEGNLNAVRQKYGQIAQAGQVKADDFWSQRDPAVSSAIQLAADGERPKDEVDREFYEKAIGLMAVRYPGYRADKEDTEDFAHDIDAANVATGEAQKHWRDWRNVHLGVLPEVLGLRTADEVFVGDWARLGSGEITPWPMGSYIPQTRTADAGDDAGWLVAAR